MQSDQLRGIVSVEMAFDSVADLSTQIVDGFSLREDGLPGRSSRKTAFGGFLHQENDLAHVALQEGRGHLARAEKATQTVSEQAALLSAKWATT